MAIRVVRFGDPRAKGEGVRLGTVRRPPRGVGRADVANRFYDVWLPELAPSEELLRWARSEALTDARWKSFTRRYLREMKDSRVRHLIETLAVLSRGTDVTVGCYCEDASRCHRSLLATLLAKAGADLTHDGGSR